MKNLLFLFSFIFAISAQLMAQTIMNIHQSNGTVLQIPVNTIDSITYTITNPGNLASITTTAISSNTGTSAVSGGNITNNGGSLVTSRGVCWSTSPNPTTANNITTNGSGTGSFTSTLTGLTANTTYYVRAYAINSAGTAYGNQVSFTAGSGGSGIVSNPGPGVTYNGYNYPTIILGNGQEWMAQNLRTTTYANGDPISNVTDSLQWGNLSTGAWCYYNNSSQYENPYGKLYNWYAVADIRNVCPAGWHIPTESEWNSLLVYLDTSAVGSFSSLAGGKMKSIGTQYWQSPNTGATNQSGFSGFPGGIRSGISGGFANLGPYGYWWSFTVYNTSQAFGYVLQYQNQNAGYNLHSKKDGLSVRCLKD
jgi:uncharacterized protein (TIGR02145 family)